MEKNEILKIIEKGGYYIADGDDGDVMWESLTDFELNDLKGLIDYDG
jgi:hypothetical protein